MKYFILFFWIAICLFITGCKQKRLIEKKHITEMSGQLIPIDFNDSDFRDLPLYAIDTFTKDGWSINYYVKDDSSKYDDIYIKWLKENIGGIYKSEGVLQFRRYFIPEYVGENKKCLFLTHGCATDCRAVLVLYKDSSIARDYMSVIDYNIPNGQIAYVTDEGNKDNLAFQLAVVDLLRNKEHIVQFKNLCMSAAYKESCVDTIVFNKDNVTIRATLTVDDYNRDKEITEEKTIILK